MHRFVSALLLAAPLGLASCGTPAPRARPVSPEASVDRTVAVLWFQAAAEMRALYYQAFNIARERLDAALARRTGDDKLAVVVDIDETILDNGPLEASLVKNHQPFRMELWKQWSQRGVAEALPGAQPFLTYAASNRVDVFYVSNRNVDEFDATARNLREKHFPMVDAQHLLLSQGHEGKEPRRRNIAGKYNVVLLMGDNLGDFSGIFERQTPETRGALTDENREKFGRIFIVLPNPMYGGWEDALYPPGLSEEQKAALRRSVLRSEP
ncbi:MAG TPA: 5'-nucleotidase, lipoprotein e(P4) family [Verrucomicrobiae bacterium]|jgi:5'-nucleotidase (lipoprotein e(P4) family)|nr:5'-nucleotidase, lipoprotein e(P4) family [Verrucomicrobiae bacterium]